MTLWKHPKRLWTLLTTEEVFDEHCSIGRQSVWCAGHLGARGQETIRSGDSYL